jgi:hypothetical protein
MAKSNGDGDDAVGVDMGCFKSSPPRMPLDE